MYKDIDATLADKEASKIVGRPVVLDIGGEEDEEGVINFNPTVYLAKERRVPHLLIRDQYHSPIPLPDHSVDIIYIFNVPLTGKSLEATASEVKRVIAKGGVIHILNTTEGKGIPDYIAKVIGEKGSSEGQYTTNSAPRPDKLKFTKVQDGALGYYLKISMKKD